MNEIVNMLYPFYVEREYGDPGLRDIQVRFYNNHPYKAIEWGHLSTGNIVCEYPKNMMSHVLGTINMGDKPQIGQVVHQSNGEAVKYDGREWHPHVSANVVKPFPNREPPHIRPRDPSTQYHQPTKPHPGTCIMNGTIHEEELSHGLTVGESLSAPKLRKIGGALYITNNPEMDAIGKQPMGLRNPVFEAPLCEVVDGDINVEHGCKVSMPSLHTVHGKIYLQGPCDCDFGVAEVFVEQGGLPQNPVSGGQHARSTIKHWTPNPPPSGQYAGLGFPYATTPWPQNP